MLDTEEGVLATYYIETSQNLAEVAKLVAVIETTGSWIGREDPPELFTKCMGKVYDIREYEKGKGLITILLPTINMNLENAAFADIWLSLVGGATFDLAMYTKSRLVDFQLPSEGLEHFPGPKFGLRLTRERLGLRGKEPIIGMIIKPTSGLMPEQVAEICYEAAMGGVRFIKDDEKMLNPSYCPLGKRVKSVVKALEEAEKQTGLNVLYAPHISADSNGIDENVKGALSNGANALMLNFFASGFSSLKRIAEDADVDVPIYAHCGGRSALSRVSGQGVDPVVIAKLARLCGGDYFRVGTLDGYLVGSLDEMIRIADALREKLSGIRDSVPVISGGLDASNLAKNIEVFGMDALYLAGSSILSHPMGTRAGAKALQQAAEAHEKGVLIDEYMKDHKELQVAVEKVRRS